jgi:DNA polymerase-3 subunit chi
MQVDFYQLGRSPIERVLASIAGRVLGEGGRLLVVTGDDSQAAAIDEGLWTVSPDGFLPHGRDGADQPVLIAADCEAVNGARTVALVDGHWRDEALRFDRALHFFDDRTVEAARIAWKGLRDRPDVTRNYWTQDEDGRWGKLA